MPNRTDRKARISAGLKAEFANTVFFASSSFTALFATLFTTLFATLSAALLLTSLWFATPAYAQPMTDNSVNANNQSDTTDIAPVAEADPASAIAPGPRTPAAVTKPYAPAAMPKSSPSANIMNVMFGLLLILALIFGLAWLMRKMGQGGLLNNSQIKIVAAMPLGTRERLVVVDVSGQQLLLGITATQINTLHVFPEPVIDQPDVASQSEFGKKLLAILQQKPSQTNSSVQPVVPAAATTPSQPTANRNGDDGNNKHDA